MLPPGECDAGAGHRLAMHKTEEGGHQVESAAFHIALWSGR